MRAFVSMAALMGFGACVHYGEAPWTLALSCLCAFVVFAIATEADDAARSRR